MRVLVYVYICVLNVEQVCMYRSLSFRLNGSDKNGYLKFMHIYIYIVYIRLPDLYSVCTLYTEYPGISGLEFRRQILLISPR